MPADPRPAWVPASRQRIGLRISRLRAARGMTVDGLADASGLDRKSVMRAETGARYVRLDVLLMLARGLGLSLAEMVAEDPAADTGAAGDRGGIRTAGQGTAGTGTAATPT